MSRFTKLVMAGALVLGACGGGSGGGDAASGSDSAGGGGDGGGGGADGPVVEGDFVRLITADWTLASGDEGYTCATKTITEDTYIGAIRSLSPEGTHHTTLDVVSGGGADDPGSACGPEFGKLYASGVGTGALVLPEGVGLHIAAGQKLRVNLHLYNYGEGDISGTSGIEAVLVPAAEVTHVAEMTISNLFIFSVDEGAYSITNNSGATPGTMIAIFPHMHQLGTHSRVRLIRDGSPIQTLWDQDYQFESQEFELLPSPVEILPGDELETTCTWQNDTGSPVSIGDGSDKEMCFTLTMTY